METIQVARSDGVATVVLNRPEKKNAINELMWRELLTTIREINDNPEDRVLLLTGASGDFSSGADLSESADDLHPLVRMRRIGDVALNLYKMSKPTVAKVSGVAFGAGCNLALGCDLVVASADATFCQVFSQRGLSVDFGGTWLLPRIVGLRKAMQLALLAEPLTATSAAEIGLVNEVVQTGQLDAFVDAWARRLADGPPLALSLTKSMIHDSGSLTMDQALEAEARSQAVNIASDDTAEAIAAFFAKRDARFSGR